MSVVGTVVANLVANTEQFNKDLAKSGDQFSAFTKHINAESRKMVSDVTSHKITKQLNAKDLGLDVIGKLGGINETSSAISGLTKSVAGLGAAGLAATGIASIADMMIRGKDATIGWSGEINKIIYDLRNMNGELDRQKLIEDRQKKDENAVNASLGNAQKSIRDIEESNRKADTPRAPKLIGFTDQESQEYFEDINRLKKIKEQADAKIFSLNKSGSPKEFLDKRIDDINKKAESDTANISAWAISPDWQKASIKSQEKRDIAAANDQYLQKVRERKNAELEAQIADEALKKQDQRRDTRIERDSSVNNFLQKYIGPVGGFMTRTNKFLGDFKRDGDAAQGDFEKRDKRKEIEREFDPVKKFQKQIQDIDSQRQRLGLDDATVGRMKLGAWKDFDQANRGPEHFASAVRAGSREGYNVIVDAMSKKEQENKTPKEILEQAKKQTEIQGNLGKEIATQLATVIKVANFN